MNSTIKTYPLEDHKIIRAQIIQLDSFQKFHFARPAYDEASFKQVTSLYCDYIIRKYASVFGTLILFTLNEETIRELDLHDPQIFDPLAILNTRFQNDTFLQNNTIGFRNEATEKIFRSLQEKGLLVIARGNRKSLRFLPVGSQSGFLSRSFSEYPFCVNSSFFTMDPFDLASPYDRIGVPLGLMIENGTILNPPQYDREALLVHEDGTVSIETVFLNQVRVRINDQLYEDEKNCRFYERPHFRKTPGKGYDIVILNGRVIALYHDQPTIVPSGGFIIETSVLPSLNKLNVTYDGFEDIEFAVQVGNSVLRKGILTKRFLSPFYRFYLPFSISYPPSMYPLNFTKARAPRILFGADQNGKPMILWIEGAGKFGHRVGEESEGASLSEAGKIAADAGMYNGIHLDGGGSAQILINGKRSLRLSDRHAETYEEKERAVPVCLIVQ